MEIRISDNETSVAAKLNGPVTEADGQSLRQTFEKLVDSYQQDIHLDLSHVPIMTSTGIGKLIVLFNRLKKQNRKLVISAIHENLHSMFRSINLDKMLTIEQ